MKHDIQLTGLENILNEASLKEINPSNFKFIAANKIIDNAFNKGRQTDENIQLIKQSIIDAGLINALVVYPEGDSYKLIAGHGRLAALKQLKTYNFQGNEHDSDEIPVFIDRTKRTDLEQNLNVLRANAQKDESIQQKIETVKKAQELFYEKRRLNTLQAHQVNKRDFIASVTGYSSSSVRDYLAEINHPNQKPKPVKPSPAQQVYKHIQAIDKLICNHVIDPEESKHIQDKLEELKQLLQ